MKTITKAILLFVLFAIAAYPQARRTNSYTVTCSLSGAGACTVQQPASGARLVEFAVAYIYCASGCTVSQERDGTAASSTSATVRKVNPQSDTATATAWTDSNVGSGAAIYDANAIVIASGSRETLDLSDIQLRGNGTAINYTIRTSAAAKIIIKWREF